MDAHDITASVPRPLPVVASPPWQRAVVGFAFDFVLACVLLLVASVACTLLWAVVRGARLGLQGATASDPAQLFALIGSPGALALIAITIVSTSSTALALYFWRRRASMAERARSWQAARHARTWAWALLVGALSFAVTMAASALGQRAGIEQMPTNQPLIESVSGPHPGLLLAFAVVLAPLYEELLFRRVLFGRLWAAGRPWLGMALSSMAFALMHELPGLTGNDWPATLLLWTCYAAMGATFAWVYRRTGTLWAAIGAHATNNLLACTLLLAGMG